MDSKTPGIEQYFDSGMLNDVVLTQPGDIWLN